MADISGDFEVEKVLGKRFQKGKVRSYFLYSYANHS